MIDHLLADYRKAIVQVLALQGRLAYARVPDVQSEHAAEARARIEQMRFALLRCRILQAATQRVAMTVQGLPADQLRGPLLRRWQRRRGRLMIAMSFYAEAFYYFAHRAAESLQRVDGFKNFKPIGTRNVRNNLIEHPVAVHRNFNIDRPEGFRLKPYRRQGASAKFPDAGLYPNAEEFVRLLLVRLQASDATFRKDHPDFVEGERRRRAWARKWGRSSRSGGK